MSRFNDIVRSIEARKAKSAKSKSARRPSATAAYTVDSVDEYRQLREAFEADEADHHSPDPLGSSLRRDGTSKEAKHILDRVPEPRYRRIAPSPIRGNKPVVRLDEFKSHLWRTR
jgi:hypothetical protein